MSERDYDPLNPRKQSDSEKKETDQQRIDRERNIEDLKYLMGQPQGRRFVWRLLERAGVFRNSFSLNGLEMAFKEGNRNLGTFLLTEIHEHCPGRYVEMMKEQKREHEHRSGKR